MLKFRICIIKNMAIVVTFSLVLIFMPIMSSTKVILKVKRLTGMFIP